jgi:hypothetical protein
MAQVVEAETLDSCPFARPVEGLGNSVRAKPPDLPALGSICQVPVSVSCSTKGPGGQSFWSPSPGPVSGR